MPAQNIPSALGRSGGDGGGGCTFRRFCRVLVREQHLQLEEPAFPDCLVLAWDRAFPFLEVEDALGGFGGAGYEAEGVVFAPILSAP